MRDESFTPASQAEIRAALRHYARYLAYRQRPTKDELALARRLRMTAEYAERADQEQTRS